MKWLFGKKRTNRSRAPVFNKLDTHKWSSKMEMHRLIAGKPELRLSVTGPQ
ncbi:MAG: hypothetical protein ACYTBJ_13335 [Planctomycetota bacterium]|jgi:hypothetical protein